MLRQKFIDRLRKKYQTGGTSSGIGPLLASTDMIEKPTTEYLKQIGKTPVKNFLSNIAPKLAKYVAPASTALSGIGTGALLYDFYNRGQRLSDGKVGDINAKSAFSGGKSWAETKAASTSNIWNRQTGGIYNQMQQYQGGGTKFDIGDTESEFFDKQGNPISPAGSMISGDIQKIYTDRSKEGLTSSDTLYYNMPTGDISYYDPETEETSKLYKGYSQKRDILQGGNWPVANKPYLGTKKQTGGMALPGGEMEPIPGSDAVEFTGADHDEGGIMLDPQTEVEDGETMDQVTMARGGGPRDYFFSSHLKKGGRSFADMHKDILRNGGDQQEIDWLASMQENVAGRSSNKVGTAKLGGVMKYQTGGEDYLYDDEDLTYTDVPPADQTREQYYADMSNPLYNTNPALVTSDATRDYNKYLESLTPQDRGAMSFEDWTASRKEDKPSFKDKVKNLFKKKELTDEEIYKRSLRRKAPVGAYIGGAAQLLPAAYAFLHKQPEAQQIDYTPGFTSPIIAERGKASKLDRVNYNVERARNAGDMRAINKYIETSGGGPANVINKMMAYSKKQQGDAKIAAEETRANAAIANREAQLAQQMELSNLQRSQQASTATAQLSQREAARADEVEAINAAAKQKRIDDMEYMRYQGLSAAAQGIAGIVGDSLNYKAQERLAQVLGSEGIYEREKIVNFLMKEGMTAKEAKKKARELYNKYNPKKDEDESV